MEAVNKIPCSYCGWLNNTDLENCQACGAPLEVQQPEKVVDFEALPFERSDGPFGVVDQQNDLEQIQKVLQSAAGFAYSIAWRTAAEAIAIGIVAFSLGVIGAITNLGVGAFLGALLVGGAIGSVVKNFWFTLFSAPMGALAGFLLGVLLSSAGGDPRLFVVSTSLIAILGAILGGRRPTNSGWWQRFRPLLGVLGAAIFVILGLIMGEGLQQLSKLFN